MNYKISLLKPDIISAKKLMPWLTRIDENCWYTNFGPLNREFEQEISHELNLDSGHVATAANGTSALQLSIEALNLPCNTLVLIPALTFVATAAAVIKAGLNPIVADVDIKTWSLTPEIALSVIKKHDIKAVVPVATFGVPQNLESWDIFTETTGVPVIIDAAGAFGNQSIGNTTTAIFSLHTTKTLSSGEGGLVVSPDKKIIEQVKQRSNFGIDHYQSGLVTILGLNAKLSEYHAAVGLANLKEWQHKRLKKLVLLGTFWQKITELNLPVQFQKGQKGCVLSIFNIRLTMETDVEAFKSYLTEKGIETRRWYYPLIPSHPAFSNLLRMESLTNSEVLSKQLIGLPFHMQLKEQNIDFICKCLSEYYKG